MKQRSYNDFQSWKKFQPYFPDYTQIKEGEEPEEEYFDWKDYHIHVDRYLPKGEDKNVKVILVHGGGANGRLMFPLGVVLSNQGYECISADMPGFGLTEIRKPNSYNTWIELVVELIEREHLKDGNPIFLAGISLGGMLSYQAACLSNKVKGLIVSTLADTRRKDIQIQLSRNKTMGTTGVNLTKRLSKLTDGVKIPIKATTKMWAMANNKEFVKLLEKDKVGSGSWVYVKFLRTLFEASPPIEPEDFNKCPLLFLQPENDNITPWWVSKDFYNRLACPKEKIVLTNAGHIPLEEPGTSMMRDASLDFLRKHS